MVGLGAARCDTRTPWFCSGLAEFDQPLDHVFHHPVGSGSPGGYAHSDWTFGQEGQLDFELAP